LDFAGPLFVQDEKLTESNEVWKTYICLFTCASTRGVHLELTTSLDVSSFLLALCRFSAWRGLPAILISNNAKSFKAASKEVDKICRFTNYLTNNRITWNFIAEKAPWWGGLWERMVHGVKRSLKKTIGRSNLSFEELRTLLVEVESVVNARPLTYGHDDTEGIDYALTPDLWKKDYHFGKQ